MSSKNVLILLSVGITIGFSNHCDAYTWKVVNWLEKPVMVKINLLGEGPSKEVPPSIQINDQREVTVLKPNIIPISTENKIQAGCCIKNIEVYPPGHPEKSVTLPVRSVTAQGAAQIARYIGRVITRASVLPLIGIVGPVAAVGMIVDPLVGAGILVSAAVAEIEVGEIAVIRALAIDAREKCSSKELLIAADAAYIVVDGNLEESTKEWYQASQPM